MKTVIKKVFEILGVAPDNRLPDQTDLAAVQIAAKQMSVNPNYRDVVIVVVELGSEFCVDTSSYVRRQYLHYPFREAADYRRIVCLKAAYCNGKRMDTSQDTDMDAASSKPGIEGRYNRPAGASLVWGKPGRWAIRNQDEQSFVRN